MPASLEYKTALRRPSPPLPAEVAEASGPSPEVILAVAGLAVALVTAPLVVAVASILDAGLLDGARSWVQEASTWLSYLMHAGMFLGLPLAAVVARAQEDA